MLRSTTLAGLLVLSVTLAGCGGSDDDISDLSATKILAETKKAVADADDVSVKGSSDSGGTSVKVDLGFADEDGTGTLTIDGNEITVLSTGGKDYFKAEASFYDSLGASGDTVSKAVGDKWIIVPKGDANLGSIAQFSDRDEFFKQLLDPDGTITKTKTKKIDGTETVGLKSPTGTLYVATDDGRPISLTGEEQGQTLTFDYDDVKVPAAPAADDVVDLNSLGS